MGWGKIELDQINQKRFNEKLAYLNKLLTIFNKKLPLDQQLHELDPIDLEEVRSRFEGQLKAKKARNQEIRKLHRPNERCGVLCFLHRCNQFLGL